MRGYWPTPGLYFFAGGADPIDVTIEERYMAALLRQPLADSGADPAAGTRHQCNPVC